MAAAGRPYRFPERTTKYLRRAYQGPGVYCWRVERPRVASVVYIGETERVERRLRGFLGPGQQMETNLRLNQMFKALAKGGAEITLEVLAFPAFEVNGYEVSMERLGSPHVRRLVESIAILSEMKMGSMVLNRGKELLERQKARLFPLVQQMEEGERKRFLKFLASRAGKTQL